MVMILMFDKDMFVWNDNEFLECVNVLFEVLNVKMFMFRFLLGVCFFYKVGQFIMFDLLVFGGNV